MFPSSIQQLIEASSSHPDFFLLGSRLSNGLLKVFVPILRQHGPDGSLILINRIRQGLKEHLGLAGIGDDPRVELRAFIIFPAGLFKIDHKLAGVVPGIIVVRVATFNPETNPPGLPFPFVVASMQRVKGFSPHRMAIAHDIF
jgi:hypothetical protein